MQPRSVQGVAGAQPVLVGTAPVNPLRIEIESIYGITYQQIQLACMQLSFEVRRALVDFATETLRRERQMLQAQADLRESSRRVARSLEALTSLFKGVIIVISASVFLLLVIFLGPALYTLVLG